MNKICKRGKSKAQSLVEYGLILALVSVVAITVLQTMGSQIKNTVTGLTGQLTDANKSSACTSTNGTWNAAGTTDATKCVCPTGKTLNTTATSVDYFKCL